MPNTSANACGPATDRLANAMSSRSLLVPLTLLVGSPAIAMQDRLTRFELCVRADLVVIGEVTSAETVWTEDGIERHAWVAVGRTISGRPRDTVEVRLPGGTIGELRHWVEDVPELEEDLRYLLFLYEDWAGGLQVLGGDAGAVRIQPPAGGEGEPYISALASVGRCGRP